MENNFSLKFFYESIMKDYKSIIQMFASEKTKKKIEEIKDIPKFCLNFLNNYYTDDKNMTFILDLIKNYIDDINQNLKNEEIVNDKIKVNEHDIYKAYGLLWGLDYVFSNSKDKDISEFNYKKYKNLSEFLEIYGSYSLLSKNYKKNYSEEIKDKQLDIKFINRWLEKLNEKRLKSMKDNSIANKKSKKKKKNLNGKEINCPNNKENNKAIENSNEIQEEIKQVPYNENEKDKKISEESEKINIIKENENNENSIKESMPSPNIDNKEKIDISKEKIIDISFIAQTPPSKMKPKTSDDIRVINNNIKDKENYSEVSIKSVSINNNLINNNKAENINGESIDKLSNKINLNSLPETINDLSNKNQSNSQALTPHNLSDKNNSSLQNEINKDPSIKSNSNYLNTKNINLAAQNKSSPQSETYNDSYSQPLTNEELTKIVLSIRKELKEKTEELNKKIDRLEKNQLLMYHQMQMYQSSRDIEKSINYFYYDYLYHDSTKVASNEFGKLQNIIKYLNNKDYSKLNETQKIKLRKYFRFHFFANRVSNKILHRNFKDDSKKILEEKRKNNDLIGLIPGFDFDECFDSLAYFIENNVKNPQLNKAMEIVYKEDYIKDMGLNEIRDCGEEVIRKNENGIEILLSKNDIEEIRNYFKTVTLKDNSTSFVDLCNNKIWDRGSKELI